jgi:glycine hydroxymethyltransferase
VTNSATGVAAVLSAASAHHEASRQLLHLVPSENGLSVAARIPHLMEAAVRYAFPGPESGKENWAWPGRQDLVVVERNAAERLGAQLGAAHVNVKSVSGVSAPLPLTSAGYVRW